MAWAAIAAGASVAAQDSAPLRVAAAANLTYALQALDSGFAQRDAAVRVVPVFGASGSLVAQIENGAPFDVFLSADPEFSRELVRMGGADPHDERVFALGRLVLWTTEPGLELSSVRATVASPAVRRLAIANPRTAPFGRAAQEVLERLELAGVAAPKLVIGENIAQAAEFVQTGNADAGFVALSLLVAPDRRLPGRWIEVESGLYSPLEQTAVLTIRGRKRPEARAYLNFLTSPEAGKILAGYGYGTPR